MTVARDRPRAEGGAGIPRSDEVVGGGAPVVYGEPGRMVALLDSVFRLMALEPDEVMDDGDVRRSAGRLTALIRHRVGRAGPS